LNQLKKIEQQNGIGIAVYRCWEDAKIGPYRAAPADCPEDKIVDLLQLTSEKGGHFVLITDLHKLITRQLGSGHCMRHLCRRCFYVCKSDELWERHQRLCASQKVQEIRLPPANCPRRTDKFSYLSGRGLHAARVKECEAMLPFVMFGEYCFKNYIILYHITYMCEILNSVKLLNVIFYFKGDIESLLVPTIREEEDEDDVIVISDDDTDNEVVDDVKPVINIAKPVPVTRNQKSHTVVLNEHKAISVGYTVSR